MRKIWVGLVVTALLAGCGQQVEPNTASAQAIRSCSNLINNPNGLDRWFGFNCSGYVSTAASFTETRPNLLALAAQNDSTFVALLGNDTSWRVGRYTSNTSNNSISTTLSVPQATASSYGLALQSDGKAVVVLGRDSGLWELKRFNPDGNLDTSFNPATIPGIISSKANAVLVQPDDKILVAGAIYPDQFSVVRYTPDGQLDTSFNQTGYLGQALPQARDLALWGDKLVSVSVSPEGKLLLLRFNSDGSWDTSFGGTGLVVDERSVYISDQGPAYANSVNLGVLSNGKVLVSVSKDRQSTGTGIEQSYALRFEASGAVDQGFGTNGEQFLSIYPAIDMVLQSDGKAVVNLVGLHLFILDINGQGLGGISLRVREMPPGSSGPNWSKMAKLPSDDRFLVGAMLISRSNNTPTDPIVYRFLPR